jgi:hypothetical protein
MLYVHLDKLHHRSARHLFVEDIGQRGGPDGTCPGVILTLEQYLSGCLIRILSLGVAIETSPSLPM